MTILGTRPEIIRLSRIIPNLDELCDHKWTPPPEYMRTDVSDTVCKIVLGA